MLARSARRLNPQPGDCRAMTWGIVCTADLRCRTGSKICIDPWAGPGEPPLGGSVDVLSLEADDTRTCGTDWTTRERLLKTGVIGAIAAKGSGERREVLESAPTGS